MVHMLLPWQLGSVSISESAIGENSSQKSIHKIPFLAEPTTVPAPGIGVSVAWASAGCRPGKSLSAMGFKVGTRVLYGVSFGAVPLHLAVETSRAGRGSRARAARSSAL